MNRRPQDFAIPILILMAALACTPPPAQAAEQEAVRLNNKGVAAMDDGHFRDAIRWFEQAAAISPEDTIRTNLALAMNNLAVRYLSDTRPDPAIAWLSRALSIHPGEALKKNLAQALIMKGHLESDQGRPESAQHYFREAVAADPSSGDAHEWLGRTLYDAGQLTEALGEIELAYRLDRRVNLKTLLDKIRREIQGERNFFDYRSLHFRISYSPDIDFRLVSRAAGILEKSYQDHRYFLGEAPKQEIPAVLYSSKDAFTTTHELTSNVAGIYDGKVRIPLTESPDWTGLERTLSHEIAHAFLFDIGGPDIPLWMNEGLAELLSAGPERPLQSLDEARRKNSPLIPLPQLSEALKDLKNNSRAALAYDQSYAIIKFTHDRFGIFGIRRLLRAVQSGRSEDQSVQDSFFMSLPMLEQAWMNQLK